MDNLKRQSTCPFQFIGYKNLFNILYALINLIIVCIIVLLVPLHETVRSQFIV